MEDTPLMLHTLLELGESMLTDGAEIRSVEDTLRRMGMAYGAVRMDVFVITSSIVLTMCFSDGTSATQTRRIEKSGMTNFRKLEDINSLSRAYCEKPFPAEELSERMHAVKYAKPSVPRFLLGSVLAGFAFTVFFGGSAADGLLAAAFALLICALQLYLPLLCRNKVMFNFLSAFATGLLISLCGRLLPSVHSDKVIIGDIMLLIPGIAFTNSVKNLFVGDTLSGIMRMIETLLWAAALTIGFVLASWLLGV